MTTRRSRAQRASRSLHVEDLIGAPVEDAAGKKVGRVVDLEVQPHEDWEVTALVLGRFPFLDRFDTLRAIPYRLRGFGQEQMARWADVEAFENRRVRLRAGARLVPASGVPPSGTAGEPPEDPAVGSQDSPA
jgi:sporulation protein YlmC with PRC-barrel domain